MPSPRRIIAKICFSQSIQRLANDKPAHFKKIAEEVQVNSAPLFPATTFPAPKFWLEWGRKDHHFFIFPAPTFPAPTFPAHSNNCLKKLLSAILVFKKHKSNK
jgi:hypothetical protein